MTATSGADPAAPVIIGAAQVTHRDRAAATSAEALLGAAADQALADTSAGAAVRARIAAVGVTQCLSWSAVNPAAELAAHLGAGAVRTVATRAGGTGPLDLLHHACAQIRAGDRGVTVLAGGEALRAAASGLASDGPGRATTPADETLGIDRPPSHPAEERAGMFQPLNYYPLFENAIRAVAGRSVADHRKHLGDLWARFAQVAATNPYAWLDGPAPTADRIVTADPGNRMVAHPYPKLLTANIAVDQAAAVVVCSAATAAAAGVPRDRWVFVAAGASAHDHWFVSTRQHLHRSPALAASGRAALAHAGLGIDDVAHLDLYSCFPSAVQIAAAELGVDVGLRTLTVTGGLTFAGGPANSYAFHALAALTDRVRTDGGAALATAVGWFLTKHAVTVLSATPPAPGFSHADVQSDVDARPARAVAVHGCTATVESWTASYDRGGDPSTATVTCLLPDGARAVATTTDPAAVADVVGTDPLGAAVRIVGDGTFVR